MVHKTLNRKLVSVLLTLVMIFSLFAGMTVTASATNGTWSGTGTATDPYQIADLADLKAIATNLSSSNTYSGKYFKLMDNITIDNDTTTWTPIGNSSVAFAGYFDGNKKTITWSGTATGGSYWGVFGKSTGVIANVKTTGSLTLSGTSGSYVSPLAGYSGGSVYNCQNSAAFTAEKMDNAGGIAGALETTATSALANPITIQYCGNTGNITASKRVGGVVGAVYCNYKGNAVVDQSYSKDCTIYTRTSSSKVWSGGLAGYVKGGITNSYSNNIALQASGGRYLSGLIGILNGSNPSAYATDCYANVASYTNCSTGYDRPFVGSVDSSSAVKLTDCWWTENVSGYTQDHASSGWGTQSNVGIINAGWTNLTIDTTNYFNTGSQPTLKWETNTGFTYDVTTGTSGSTTSNTVHLGGSTSGAYTDLDSALNAAGAGGTVLVDSTITISSSMTNHTNAVVKRGAATGALFNVTGGTVRLTTMVIDGQNSGTLFNVSGGELVLRGNVELKNCATAVALSSSGKLTVNKAKVTGTTNSVDVGSSSSIFTIQNYGETAISGDIALASGAFITVGAPSTGADAIPGTLTVNSAVTDPGTVIAVGTSGTLDSTDISKISVSGHTLWLNGNQIEIFY